MEALPHISDEVLSFMKFPKKRNKNGITAGAKNIMCICCTLLILLLTSCGTENTVDNLNKEPPSAITDTVIQPTESTPSVLFPKYHDIESSEAEEIRSKCQEIALLCNDLMVNGETETSPYFPYDTTLTQSAIDDVEALLAEAGYPVINSDSKYPEYLENSDGLKHFFELTEKGENAQQSIICVSLRNSIYYITFQYADGTLYYVNATISWDEDGKITVADPSKLETIDWGMTYNGYFYYQIYPLDRHWSACSSIRLEPTDKELYDLYLEYLTPVGYPSGVFTLDWDKSNYGDLCFNDLFEALYKERYGDWVYEKDYEYYPEMQCSLIPTNIFENTILPYFQISLDEFRASTLYMKDKNAYPWQTLNCSNIIYCPTLTPEVTKCRDNEDGTFTIVVDVLCFDYKCFPMFTHEITIKPNIDGGFQYVANRVTYQDEKGVPAATPRLEAQRK